VLPLALGSDRRAGSIFDAPDTPSVGRRDRVFRRSLVLADALAASLALLIGVTVLGDDALRPAAALFVPIAVLVSKVVGLYDRDELTMHKTTLDELPALMQLATAYALVAWLVSPFIVDGTLGRDQGLGLWALLVISSLIGRGTARMLARRATTAHHGRALPRRGRHRGGRPAERRAGRGPRRARRGRRAHPAGLRARPVALARRDREGRPRA
jgi:hypothetical protein